MASKIQKIEVEGVHLVVCVMDNINMVLYHRKTQPVHYIEHNQHADHQPK
jgi:hypothetical protein